VRRIALMRVELVVLALTSVEAMEATVEGCDG
jgi:hypothetical protein